ncbi:MAG: DUF6603 domain-containing protein, partial [Cyanobacteria bacterium J06632_3]
YTFGLEISVPYGESELRLWLMVSKTEQQLQIRLGDPDNPSIKLQITLAQEGFFASLDQGNDPKSFGLAPLGRVVSPELEDLMGTIEITPLAMAIGSYKKTGSYVLAFKLQGQVAISQLPFVGEKLPENADISIRNLSLVWCSAAIASDTIAQAYFSKKNHPLITDEALTSGGMFSAALTVPTTAEQTLKLPFKSPKPTAADTAGTDSKSTAGNAKAKKSTAGKSKSKASSKTATKSSTVQKRTEQKQDSLQSTHSDNQSVTKVSISRDAETENPAKWFDIDKTVGPLSLRRMGLKYQDQKVWFLFDTSLSAGSVTLIVDGLGAGLNPFDLLAGRFAPAFTLRGLGLEIKGPAEISGAFLRDRISDPRGDYDEFSGVVLIKTEALTISGMGSYADPPWSDPAFFAYAFLDKPIGGPPFFFVTGLALGIAVNRNLDLPPIDQVSDFPLVRLALGQDLFPPRTQKPKIRDTNGDSELAELLAVQQAMKPYTRPSSGRVALAVGVRFTTFKLLNSFALLVASFGKPFKLDLLISSRLEVPALPPTGTPPPAIAQVGIDLRGTWILEEGVLLIEGRITEGSWFLDSACRLSGGAAFASWTKGPHSGDFVMSIGGYHPKFSVPAHYPQVPRLAINFSRGPIEIKGDAYFAMTPAALMAGGSLSATFAQGKFRAWFNYGADFLVAWEPFSYDATMYVEVGASYRTFMGTVQASVSAQLHLWGPDLAGIATVDIRVAKFDIKFGADQTTPQTLDAKTFQARFLPAKPEEFLSIDISSGLVRSITDRAEPIFIVNPAEFVLAIESVIPQPDGQHIGIGPMGKTKLPQQSLFNIEINGEPLDLTEEQMGAPFRAAPINKPVPAALWKPALHENEARLPNLKTSDTVIEAMVGYKLQPQNSVVENTTTQAYKRENFQANAATWTKPNAKWPSVAAQHLQHTKDAETILTEIKSTPPTDLLNFFAGETRTSWDQEISLPLNWLDDLQEHPHIVTLQKGDK